MDREDLLNHLECPICLDTFQDPVCLDCGHVYCKDCILTLQKTFQENSARCPLCKRVFKKRKKHFFKICLPLSNLCKSLKNPPKSPLTFKFELDLESLTSEELRKLMQTSSN